MSADGLELVKTIAISLSAVATFLAACVALFRDELRRALFRLSIDYGAKAPFVVTRVESGIRRLDLRVDVLNNTWTPVTDLALIVEDARIPHGPDARDVFGDFPLSPVLACPHSLPPSFVAPYSHRFVSFASFSFSGANDSRPARFELTAVSNRSAAVPRDTGFEIVLHVNVVSNSHAYKQRSLSISLDEQNVLRVLPAPALAKERFGV